MKDIKALVLCSSRLAIPVIQFLRQAELLAAVAVPVDANEVAEHAEALLIGSSIPVRRVEKKNADEQLVLIMRENHITLGLMLTFSYRLSPEVYNFPTLGFFNFHPGPLPDYRGPDPIFQQLKNGEKQIALAVHYVDEGYDSGPVVMVKHIMIEAEDSYGTLLSKLSLLCTEMTGVLLKMLSMDITPPAKKQQPYSGKYYSKQTADDVMIRWESMTAEQIVNLARACNPWNKGAVTVINGRVMRIPLANKGSVGGQETATLPGTILSVSTHELIIATIGNEAISLPFYHLEEGFFLPAQAVGFGIIPGSFFSG